MTPRAATLAVALTTLPLAGCQGALENFPGIEKYLPKVKFKKFKVNSIDFKKIDTDFVLQIDNPNPLRVALSSFGWNLDLAGSRFLGGNNADGVTIEASRSSNVRIPVSIQFAELIDSVSGLAQQTDTVPFAFRGKMGFNTPLGEVKVPYRAAGDFPVLRAPKIAFQKVRLDNINLLRQSATIAIDLGVSHQQASAIDLSGFDYALKLGGKEVISGLIDNLATVPAGKTKTVSLPVTVNLLAVGTTIAGAIANKGKIDVGLDARLKVQTPFGPVPLAIDETGNLRVE